MLILMVRKDFSSFSYGRLSEMNDAQDIAYWQTKSDGEKFAEAWRLAVQSCELNGICADELRFQRSVASLQRQKS